MRLTLLSALCLFRASWVSCTSDINFATVFSSCVNRNIITGMFQCFSQPCPFWISLAAIEMSSSSYLSFLLQCLISPLSQAVQTAELILELKQLSLVSVVRGLLLHLEATAGIKKKYTHIRKCWTRSLSTGITLSFTFCSYKQTMFFSKLICKMPKKTQNKKIISLIFREYISNVLTNWICPLIYGPIKTKLWWRPCTKACCLNKMQTIFELMFQSRLRICFSPRLSI